ncbi:hypothetical protein TBR22_A03240 [Luteitalea sp. TBR-22]|uniref:DUF192 domain-containing protein n=1 Tax=Luteitalea sp. TBR-22 TaxID=2802971 RepID=UPI001AF65D33|nr:DUF192 domain-containing protein [Luteitalea sp. TBR-22]BCS31124.1 hypothetical protein TBR22_A03240 [Luteitalea sp. TBR-22]
MTPARRTRVRGPGGALVGEVVEARTAWGRMVGLLAHTSLPVGEGLLLAPAWSIHTWFMRIPIDVVFLDGEDRVLRVFPALPAWRLVSGTRQARTVLEFGAGTLARTPLTVGDQVTFER